MTRQTIRAVTVGDRIADRVVGERPTRRLEASAIVVPGHGGLSGYLGTLKAHTDDFMAWDGRVVAFEPDGEPEHRVVVIDRYGQVYEAVTSGECLGSPIGTCTRRVVPVPGHGLPGMWGARRPAQPGLDAVEARFAVHHRFTNGHAVCSMPSVWS